MQLAGDTQMQLLRDIAYHGVFFGAPSKDEVDILVGAEGSPFVEGPHALLRVDPGGHVNFRNDTFGTLFLANGIQAQWQEARKGGPERFKTWIEQRLGERILEPLTCEFLAQLLDLEEFRAAWRVASIAPTRYQPFARRNLLAIALQIIEEKQQARPPIQRADDLADVLGGREICDTAVLGLEVALLDFKGWDLRKCNGKGGHFAFCSFDGAMFDEQLRVAEFSDCSGLEPAVPESIMLERGARRLTTGIRPWRNYAIGEAVLRPKIEEQSRGLDRSVIDVLTRNGLIVRRQGEQARWFLSLTEQGKALVHEYLAGGVLSYASPELRALLVELAELR